MGSLWGLGIYLVMWPFWWLVLKSPLQGAQSFLKAAMEAELGRGVGGRFIKECQDREVMREEIGDEAVAKRLWEFSEKQIEAVEKEGAVKRALAKKEEERKQKEKPSNKDGKHNNDEHSNGRIEEIVENTAEQSGAEKSKKGSRRSRKA